MIIKGFIAKARPRGYVGPKHLENIKKSGNRYIHK